MRTRFTQLESTTAVTPLEPRTGCCETNGRRTDYALAETWIRQSWVEVCQSDPAWPESNDAEGEIRKDKAQPHAAVVMARRVDRFDGKLTISTAVFLPLESTDDDAEFQLTLHGCFFVDAGRRAVSPDSGDTCGIWNARFRNEGVYPLVLPALEKLAETMGDDPAAIERLSHALQKWMTDDIKPSVCGKRSWLLRWTSAGLRWTTISADKPYYVIPDGPRTELPSLSTLADEMVLTPIGRPRLTAEDSQSWPDDRLGIALTINDTQALFADDGTGLKYLRKFVESATPNGTGSRTALRGTLRRIFASATATQLNDRAETLKRLVAFVPADTRRALPLGGNWPITTRQAVCGLPADMLIVPDACEPAECGTAMLTKDHAVGILQELAKAMTPGRNTFPAVAVLTASLERTTVAEATIALNLWIVQRLDGISQTTEEVVSLDLLRVARVSARGPTNEILRKLAAATMEVVTVLSPDTAETLKELVSPFGHELHEVIEYLNTTPPLASPDKRKEMLGFLLNHRPQGDRCPWIGAVRYLIHGNADLTIGETLYVPAIGGVWARLAESALMQGRPGRLLREETLTTEVHKKQHEEFGIQELNPEGIGKLIAQVGADTIDVTFSVLERDAVLNALHGLPEVLRGLRLHDAVDGSGMCRIGANCWWASANFAPAESLRSHLTLLRLSPVEHSANIQRAVHAEEFDARAAIRLALKLGPAEHWRAVLEAIGRTGSLPAEMSEALAKSAWLPTDDGGKAAPRDVLHHDKLNDDIIDVLRIVTRRADDPIPSVRLHREVRDGDGFNELARQLFPDLKPMLGRLTRVLYREDRFAVGAVDLRDPERLHNWLHAFRDAPDDVMAAHRLVQQVHKADAAACLGNLLPSLGESISTKRMERILDWLRQQVERGGRRSETLRVHNEYLKLAARDRVSFPALLPRLKLLNQLGAWADPETLCAGATGIEPKYLLNVEHAEIVREVIQRRPPTTSLATKAETTESFPQNGEAEDAFDESVSQLRFYFEPWKATETLSFWAGALISLLGDHPAMRELAVEFLPHVETPELILSQCGLRHATHNLRVQVVVTDAR